MLMKDFYRRKAQMEKVGDPVAIFKIKRVSVSDDFDKFNKKRNYTLEKTLTYPVYYDPVFLWGMLTFSSETLITYWIGIFGWCAALLLSK
ncbi:MAG TPA: hypothetical protein VK136_10105 [Bacillota bacterium]|nr:hypothetical protein [Bacillota bacterium]